MVIASTTIKITKNETMLLRAKNKTSPYLSKLEQHY